MELITSPNPERPIGRSIFLAGAIDLGAAPNWQLELAKAIDALPIDVNIYNPRREDWDNMASIEPQILWELSRISTVDLVVFYIPEGSKAPITLLELGLVLASKKPCIVYCSEGFYRFQNVETTCNFYGVPVYTNDSDFFNDLVLKIARIKN